MNSDLSSHYWYRKNEDKLLILGVGGNSCFNFTINHLLNIGRMSGEDFFDRIVIITDRDNNINDESIIKELQKQFLDIDSKFQMKNNSWNNFEFNDNFGETTSVEIGTIIIPFKKEGALETFLVDALSEDIDNKYVVDKVREFIREVKSPKYLNKDRLKVKAELGVTLAVISPEKVFTTLDEMIKQVPWEKYKTIQNGFEILDSLHS